MSDCEQVLQELEMYLDGELADGECRRIEQHLADCHGCFDRDQFRRSLRDIIRRKCGTEEIPTELEARIKSSIRETP